MGRKQAAGAKATKAKAAADSSSGSSSSSSGGSRVQQLSSKQQRRKGDDSSKKSWSSFNAQLRPFGLCLRSIGGDGNCLFRALADQLSGSQDRHAEYRGAIVEYMRAHPLDFAPFVWEGTFADYLARMARNGEWGGAAELAAAGRCYGVHIAVHQYNAPRLLNVYDENCVTVDPADPCAVEAPIPVTRDTRTIHLAYHDGEHYSSVRNISDANSNEPATPIVIVEGALLPSGSGSSSSSSSSSPSLTQQETIVMQSTSCKNLAKVRLLLHENWNDADAVVEILYAEVAMGLDVNVDHDALESAQRAEIEQQRRDEENKEAAERVRQMEREQREKEKEQEKEQERQAQKRQSAAEDSSPDSQSDASRRVQPAADDCAESDSEGDGEGGAGADAEPPGTEAEGESNGDGANRPAFSSAAAASTSSAASSSSSSSARPPGSGSGSGSSNSRPAASSAAPKRVSGRDKKVAAKHAKMMADKLKRQNKGQVKKERAAEEVQAVSDQLGTVRI